jgi:DNA-binding transcriptional ArsR family regulator
MIARPFTRQVQEDEVDMIDDLLQEIHRRLDEVLSEADKLRGALAALAGRDGSAAPGHAAAPSTSPGKGRAPARTRSAAATRARARSASGETKAAVLAALSAGEAMTASEVAAVTGLGRASVSATLSKLAKTSEVTKAQRGYQLTSKS